MMDPYRERSVLNGLPDDNERCLCYGHRTFCCKCDMEKEPAWHEVTFKFNVSTYRIKKEIPEDPEESILEEYSFFESWDIVEEDDYGNSDRVIGVTKWKKLDKN